MGREEYEEKSHQQGGARDGEEMEELPNTAHAVLREGSLECLALGRRGLFAAGKVSCHNVSAPLDGSVSSFFDSIAIGWCDLLLCYIARTKCIRHTYSTRKRRHL